jgi:hypothetical protein
MEFNNQYLTYEEYKSLGGTLGEMPFNILELKARQIINGRTQNRLKDVEKIPQEVKICVYDLIQTINKYNNSNNSISSNISSENTDGYSVTYKSGTELTEEQKKQYDDVMETDLYGVIVDNTPILYLGVNTNYYKEDLSTC